MAACLACYLYFIIEWPQPKNHVRVEVPVCSHAAFDREAPLASFGTLPFSHSPRLACLLVICLLPSCSAPTSRRTSINLDLNRRICQGHHIYVGTTVCCPGHAVWTPERTRKSRGVHSDDGRWHRPGRLARVASPSQRCVAVDYYCCVQVVGSSWRDSSSASFGSGVGFWC